MSREDYEKERGGPADGEFFAIWIEQLVPFELFLVEEAFGTLG